MTAAATSHVIKLDDSQREALRDHVKSWAPELDSNIEHASSITELDEVIGRAQLHACVWKASETGEIDLSPDMIALIRQECHDLRQAIEYEERDVLPRPEIPADAKQHTMALIEADRRRVEALTQLLGDES